MEYEGQICRAPMERSSYMLPVMVGCSYNRCRFCTLFKHLKFRKLPLAQVEHDLIRVKEAGGKPKAVFLGDGNAFDLPTEELEEILKLVRKYFPEGPSVRMDATVTGILAKSPKELEQLHSFGVEHLYLGIESGLEEVLAFMKKDHTISQAGKAIARIQDAGIAFDAHIMTGVAGYGKGMENARALAAFLNETKPERVINFSMFLHTDAPLYQEIRNGNFKPATELENLKEEKLLLEELEPMDLAYDGFHDFIEFRVRGNLKKDKEKMIKKIADEIIRQEKKEEVIAYISESWS